MAWKNYSRKCIYCGKVGPRTAVIGGYAHKRCLPENQPKPKPLPRGVTEPFPCSCAVGAGVYCYQHKRHATEADAQAARNAGVKPCPHCDAPPGHWHSLSCPVREQPADGVGGTDGR